MLRPRDIQSKSKSRAISIFDFKMTSATTDTHP